MVYAPLIELIRSDDVPRTLAAIQDWLARPGVWPADIRELLSRLDSRRRAWIVSMIRDVQCGYPAMQWGIPVLICSERARTLPDLCGVSAPVPRAINVGWRAFTRGGAGVRAMPLARRFGGLVRCGDRTLTTQIPAGEICCAVLRLTTPNADRFEIPETWWQEVFVASRRPVSTYVSARMCIPLPDALEAAEVMLKAAGCAGDGAEAPECYFLGAGARDFAVEAGLLFRADVDLWRERISEQI